LIQKLWAADTCEIRRCGSCGLAFADPLVSGGREFFELTGRGPQHYPRDRWEYALTRGAIGDIVRDRAAPVHLLEIGAGPGHFLQSLGDASLAGLVATDYNQLAVQEMRRHGFSASGRDLREMAEAQADHGRFTIICMFQVLHMMDDLDDNMECIKRLAAPDAHLFVSLPFGPMTDLQ